jgi:succinate dehydrogenase / fumarate reductase, cytochrome b subunit
MEAGGTKVLITPGNLDSRAIREGSIMAEFKRYPNNLGIGGWVVKGRWSYERYLYILHRISGLGLLTYFLMHIFVTASRAFGKNAWEATMGSLHHLVFQLGEYAVFAAFAFHAVNGIRLILVEYGFAVGSAEEPVYPYRSSVDVQRPLSLGVIVVAAILSVVGLIRYLMYWGG